MSENKPISMNLDEIPGMTPQEAKKILHPMYRHIHEDDVLCVKCEAKGFFAGDAFRKKKAEGLKCVIEEMMANCDCTEFSMNLCSNCERGDEGLTNYKEENND